MEHMEQSSYSRSVVRED